MLVIVALVLASNILAIIGVVALMQIMIGLPTLLLFVYFMLGLFRADIRRPVGRVPRLMAYILLGAPRPLSDQAGLNLANLHHLKRVAEIEQGSADWRGHYVNIVILGLATFTISSLAAGIEWLGQLDRLRFRPVFANNPAGSATNIAAVVVATVAVLATWFFYRVFSYLRDYLGTEAANRAILLSCEEAMAFLDENGLSQRRAFKFYEKRAIAEHLGCRLIPTDQKNRRARALFPVIEDHKGNQWLLISERKSVS
jgi:hypothetical protein